MSDFAYLRRAVKKARSFRLLAEFKAQYRRYRAAGDDPQSAAWWALNDWDLLEA
jgi:hypothetical protein